MILSFDGDIIYISENIENYLGLKQLDLIGNNLFDYSHPCDHNDLKELYNNINDQINIEKLTLNEKQKLKTKDIAYHTRKIEPFLLRLKCTLTEKGKCINIKSATYKVNCLFVYKFTFGDYLALLLN